ncbi:MAG: M20/M25/M40 family metallo-hydrolase [Planctomycetota bacterium]|jgi:membrane-associated protease RseP (regulator of RpoE activity)
MRCRKGRFLRWLVVIAAWSSVCATAVVAVDRRASLTVALESIGDDELRSHVEYLADDAMEGREAGSRGGRAAADYLAKMLEDAGLEGAGADGGFFQPFARRYRNVVGLVRGSEEPSSRQYLIVGAHYDHVGYGRHGNSRGPVGRVHNGADDNASGAAAVLELAEAFRLVPEPPKRSILFVFWDAEEKRMLGSRHWIAHPTVPKEHVVGMLNIDMIGRLRDNRLQVVGTRSGRGWRRLLSESNEGIGLTLDFPWTINANGDHWPFLERGVPALMLYTGTHNDYHRPSDDAHLIHAEGMQRATRLAFALLYEMAYGDPAPAFREAGRKERDSTRDALLKRKDGGPERFGADWEERKRPTRGVMLTRIVARSPADLAGLEPGDRIVRFADRSIRTSDEMTWAVAAADNAATIEVERPDRDEPLLLTVRLEGHPMRLGIRWRTDDAEPGAVILSHVVAGSPASDEGLRVGDHVYQIDGRDFADQTEFRQRARSLPGPIRFLIERDGQLRTVEIPLESLPPASLAH